MASSKLLIAGGGTGGHVLAGIAVADAWRHKLGPSSLILFVGAKGGIEERLVPKAGYPLKLIQVGALNQVSLLRRLKTLLQLPFSFLQAAWILIRFRPQFILGVGGYSSGPVILMARILNALKACNTRIAILEQNSVPGLTNRLLSRFAETVFTAFPGTESQFSHFPQHAVILTGNPVRSSMQPLPAALRNPFTVFIFGGSQGAKGVNTLVIAALPYLEDLKAQLNFIHQTGEKDFNRVVDEYRKSGIRARVEKFIHDMPTAYREASLLICRAGSSTLAEIAAVGRASLLIPLPTAADNHQEINAKAFAQAGAAHLMRQKNARGEDLAILLREMINNPSQIARMEQLVTQFYRPHAADEIVSNLISHER